MIQGPGEADETSLILQDLIDLKRERSDVRRYSGPKIKRQSPGASIPNPSSEKSSSRSKKSTIKSTRRRVAEGGLQQRLKIHSATLSGPEREALRHGGFWTCLNKSHRDVEMGLCDSRFPKYLPSPPRRKVFKADQSDRGGARTLDQRINLPHRLSPTTRKSLKRSASSAIVC